MTRLETVLTDLERRYGRLEPPYRTPFELVMWENAGYLVDDVRRRAVLAALDKAVGLTPERLLEAPYETLLALATQGGMRPQQRVEKWLQTAALAQQLLQHKRAATRTELRKFPGMGDPGVDKIQLFGGQQAVLALDSNGLRVLTRLGYGEEDKNYAVTYRSAQRAAQAELPADCAVLTSAHLLLRHHGQTICKRTTPACDACPVSARCDYYRNRPS